MRNQSIRNYLLALSFLFESLRCLGQVQVTASASEPATYPDHYFKPVTIRISPDSSLEAYGFISGPMSERLVYSEQKPAVKEVASFKKLNANEVEEVEFGSDSASRVFYPMKISGSVTTFMSKLCGNSMASLYKPSHDELGTDYILTKRGDRRNHTFKAQLQHPEEALPKENAKLFKDCPSLQQKIENGDYKNTVKDITKILSYYKENCR